MAKMLTLTIDGQTTSVNFANEAGHVFWRVYAQSPEAQEQFRMLLGRYQSKNTDR